MGSAIVWIKAKELKCEFFAIKKGNSKTKFDSYLKSGQISIAGIFFYRFETVEKNSGKRNLARH